MPINNSLHFLKNDPRIEVEWFGMRGTLGSMQYAGWEISIEELMDYQSPMRSIRIFGRHPQGIRIISYPIPVDRIMNIVSSREFQQYNRQLETIQLYVVASDIKIVLQEKPKAFAVDFSDVQAMESPINEVMSKVYNLDELVFFKPNNHQADIYVPKEDIWTMEKHLNAIKDLQSDKQKELREKVRKNRKLSEDTNNKTSSEVFLQLIAV